MAYPDDIATSVAHPVEMHHRSLIRIKDGLGTIVVVHRGTVWLTQEGDLRDIVLGPGDIFRVERSGLTLINALAESRVSVHPARNAPVRTQFVALAAR